MYYSKQLTYFLFFTLNKVWVYEVYKLLYYFHLNLSVPTLLVVTCSVYSAAVLLNRNSSSLYLTLFHGKNIGIWMKISSYIALAYIALGLWLGYNETTSNYVKDNTK